MFELKGIKSRFCLLSLSVLTSSLAMAGSVTTDGEDLVINTNSGVDIHTLDDSFKFEVSGKIQLDAVSYSGLASASGNEAFGSASDVLIRRGTLKFEGTSDYDWHYGIRFNFDGEEDGTDVDRAWIGYSGVQGLDLTFGQFRVNYGTEGATRAAWITSAERPAMYDFLAGDEDTHLGINATHAGDNYTVMLQVASQGDKPDNGNHDIYGYTGRVTWAPVMTPDQVLHLAADYHNSNASHNETKLRSRFGIRSELDDRMRIATISDTRSDDEYILEAAWQYHSTRLQAEYFSRSVEGYEDEEKVGSDVDGYYIQASYMFGSQRKYDLHDGKWKRPVTNSAYEVFARVEQTTTDTDEGATKKNIDNNVDGIEARERGEGHDINGFTLGVNYFPSRNIRTTLDYTRYRMSNIDTSADIDGHSVKDSAEAVVARLQYHF